jgi:hypothetical protein
VNNIINMTKNELNVKTGDFLLDIAKLLVAGVVLSSIFDDDMSKDVTFLWGAIATCVFIAAGYIILYKSVKK